MSQEEGVDEKSVLALQKGLFVTPRKGEIDEPAPTPAEPKPKSIRNAKTIVKLER